MCVCAWKISMKNMYEKYSAFVKMSEESLHSLTKNRAIINWFACRFNGENKKFQRQKIFLT